MLHVGVAGGAILFFLRGMNIMAILAGQAFGLMDAPGVPVGRPLVAIGAGRASELLVVRYGFDVAMAARAGGEIAVDGFFLVGLMTVETFFRIHRSLERRNNKKEEEQ
jgi:hypothetical protein